MLFQLPRFFLEELAWMGGVIILKEPLPTQDLDEFLLKHSDIRGMIDPVYVVADIGGQGGQVPDFGLANYPPVGSSLPQLTPFMTSNNYIWVFTGDNKMEHALHLIGWLQCRINGLRFFVSN